MSANGKKYQRVYKRDGCTKEQLRELVEVELITKEDYEEITGERFD